MRLFMNGIIGYEQSLFMKNRFIFDNILLNYEIMHNQILQGKAKFCVWLLNLMSIKYIIMSNGLYLCHMLLVFSFHDIVTGWIMKCVTTVFYFVQINVHRSGYIILSRDFRQFTFFI